MTYGEVHPSKSSIDWNDKQRAYWSAIADEYDSLYTSKWSRLENTWVQQRLTSIAGSGTQAILDLGCGTGLGAQLLQPSASIARYIGLDISPDMSAIAARRFAVETRVGPMEDLAWLSDGSIDLVVSLFSAVSFCPSPEQLFSEVARVLRPGGRAYLSLLGRARHGQTSPVSFRTRGRDKVGETVPARRYHPAVARALAETSGLRVTAIDGMNSFAGVLEVPLLWSVGRMIARIAPTSSHLLELEVIKDPEQEEVPA